MNWRVGSAVRTQRREAGFEWMAEAGMPLPVVGTGRRQVDGQ